MKGRDFERLARKELLPHLPGYAVRRSLIYATPVGDVLKAFVASTSAFTAERVFVETFAMPLYVPEEHLVLSIGIRLGGPSHFWTVTEDGFSQALATAMVQQGLPFLDAHGDPERLLADTRWQDPKNINMMELKAYTVSSLRSSSSIAGGPKPS